MTSAGRLFHSKAAESPFSVSLLFAYGYTILNSLIDNISVKYILIVDGGDMTVTLINNVRYFKKNFLGQLIWKKGQVIKTNEVVELLLEEYKGAPGIIPFKYNKVEYYFLRMELKDKFQFKN